MSRTRFNGGEDKIQSTNLDITITTADATWKSKLEPSDSRPRQGANIPDDPLPEVFCVTTEASSNAECRNLIALRICSSH